MKLLVCISAILCFSSCLQAAEAPMADPDLPQPIDFSFADDLLLHSPFTRAVNLEKSLQLTGIAYVDERPVATVLNTETKQRFVMTEEPNVQGWQLMTASAGADMHQTQVEMKVGDEIIAMHYQGQQLSPGSTGKGGAKSQMAGSGKEDGDKVKSSSFLGEQGRELYSSLSPEARDKFKGLIKSRLEKAPELTPEQNSDYSQKVFAKLKTTDPASAGGGKVPKPPKKKQGPEEVRGRRLDFALPNEPSSATIRAFKQSLTMRSQKQNNKAPRPFKNKNSGRDWSGGSGSGGFIPGRKVLPRVKKPEASPTPETPPHKLAD